MGVVRSLLNFFTGSQNAPREGGIEIGIPSNSKFIEHRILDDEGLINIDPNLSARLYEELANNTYLWASGKVPTVEQIGIYLECINRGVAYAIQRFGKESVPLKITFAEDFFREGEPLGVNFGFNPEGDSIIIRYDYMGENAYDLGKNSFVEFDKLDGKVLVEDSIALYTFEECCHRYDVVVNGVNIQDTIMVRDGILESNAQIEIQRLVEDEHINVLLGSNEP